jgi:hypothetical protein
MKVATFEAARRGGGALLALALAAALPASAVVVGPYTPDAYTVFLFHLDEGVSKTVATNAGGAIAMGTNAIAYKQGSAVTTDSPLDLTVVGGTGASGFTFGNFGKCARILTQTNGIGVDMNLSGGFGLSGSATTGDILPNQNLILGANNSFTVEALISLPNDLASGTVREIVCSDNGGTRGFQFRINGLNLEVNTQPAGGAATNDILVPVPTSGDHAFVISNWYHVAWVHTEVGGNPTNVLYWTSLNDAYTAANAILETNIGVINPASQLIVDIGNEARSTGGSSEGLRGYIDEVRISRVARGADQMMFATSVSLPRPTLGHSIGGSVLSLSWPGYPGWYVQSNSISVANTNGWYDIAGSQSVTNLGLSLDPARPTVHFRLRSP